MNGDVRPTRIVIVGGGFGGFFTALALERRTRGGQPDVDVTLIHDSNAMVYTPFLPQAAGGTLEPRHVVVPLRGSLRRTTVLVGAATSHDAAARTIGFTSPAGDERVVPYDHLVAAPGSVSRTLPVPGLRESAIGFKTVAEAVALRNHALEELELAQVTDDPDERAARLTFVFVGGGYAGVDALAEVEDMLHDAKRLHPRLEGDRPRFVLVEATENILPEVGQRLSSYAMRELDRRGIEIRLGTTVTDATGGGVTLSTGERLPCRTLVWTTGVRSHPTMAMLGLPADAKGRASTPPPPSRAAPASGRSATAPPSPTRRGPGSPARPPASTPCARAASPPATSSPRSRVASRFTSPTARSGCSSTWAAARRLRASSGRSSAASPPGSSPAATTSPRFPGSPKGRVAIDWAVGLLFRRDVAELGTLGHPPPLDTPD